MAYNARRARQSDKRLMRNVKVITGITGQACSWVLILNVWTGQAGADGHHELHQPRLHQPQRDHGAVQAVHRPRILLEELQHRGAGQGHCGPPLQQPSGHQAGMLLTLAQPFKMKPSAYESHVSTWTVPRGQVAQILLKPVTSQGFEHQDRFGPSCGGQKALESSGLLLKGNWDLGGTCHGGGMFHTDWISVSCVLAALPWLLCGGLKHNPPPPPPPPPPPSPPPPSCAENSFRSKLGI